VGPAVPRLLYCSLPRLIVLTPILFPSFITRGAPRQMKWETSISERWSYGREMTDQFSLIMLLLRHCRVLLHAAKLRHGTHSFTSPPKEGMVRIFFSRKIRQLRPGLNPWTWVPEASMLTTRPPKPLWNLLYRYSSSSHNIHSTITGKLR
jgi:hypothetical protein